MKLKSFSKINLSLRVLRKLKNGMHDIETNSVLVNLVDNINITNNNKDIVIFYGKHKKKINSKKNSILTSLKLLRDQKKIQGYFKVKVKKNIPVYAGLGGGTGNAVSIIKYFLKERIDERMTELFEKKIGSDFRLFLHSFSFQKKLKKVASNKNKANFFFILIFPNINCKTKDIYKRVKTYSQSSRGKYLKKMSKKDFVDMLKRDRNDLQEIVEKKYPKISHLIKAISIQKGCIISRLTGTGSICYGIFNSKKLAKLAATKLKRKYPNYWCAITKTI